MHYVNTGAQLIPVIALPRGRAGPVSDLRGTITAVSITGPAVEIARTAAFSLASVLAAGVLLAGAVTGTPYLMAVALTAHLLFVCYRRAAQP